MDKEEQREIEGTAPRRKCEEVKDWREEVYKNSRGTEYTLRQLYEIAEVTERIERLRGLRFTGGAFGGNDIEEIGRVVKELLDLIPECRARSLFRLPPHGTNLKVYSEIYDVKE